MAEDALPRELAASQWHNPSQAIVEAMPAAEGSIEFDLVKKKDIGKFRDQVKVPTRSRRQD